MGRPFDRSNVQAIILKPYAYPISRHLIFSIGNKKGARAFVREWVDSVAHGGRDLSATPEPLINIAISWTGLVKNRSVRRYRRRRSGGGGFSLGFSRRSASGIPRRVRGRCTGKLVGTAIQKRRHRFDLPPLLHDRSGPRKHNNMASRIRGQDGIAGAVCLVRWRGNNRQGL